ncbi:DNA-directed RNA polymerase II subunit like [Quillaja saponaria]|uniref:DNA-directed RNA polymerase II subunit like n=1 Tax=Quillaja saponaria TaxID=32244 RepID=A0AAD7L6V4_QUISA|nr:DNA-directed RNA polymerase II subunit like [Quillaja saponaria]
MGGMGSLVDLLLFYSHERAFFNRLVVSMGKNPQLVKKVIALWLMLEEVGYHDLIRRIHSVSETTIEAIFEEALQCLECIQPNAAEPIEESNYSTPFFVQLLDEPVNLMFFRYNRKFIYKRYEHVMKTVCNKIFGEKAAIEVVDVMHSVPVISSIGEGTSAQGSTLNISESSIEAPKQSNLNPGATEFYHFQIATQESRLCS